LNSRVAIPVNGSTKLFTVPFPFISLTHVQFSLNRVLQINPLNYRWVGPTSVEFKDAPPSGVLEIIRKTPIGEALVQFQNGAALTEDELNLAVLQNLYIAQETRDYYDALIDGSLDKLIVNVGGGAGKVIDKVIEEILDSELLADLQTRIGDIDLNATTINAQRIRLDEVEEVVDALKMIDGMPIATFLQQEQTARIEGDTALAQTIDLIGAKSGDGLSFALDLTKVKVSPTESLGMRLQGIDTSLGANQAAIASEQTARTTAISALASEVTTLTATVGANTSAILNEATARSNADSALTTQINAVAASTGANQAAIVTETNARTSAVSALASQITTLQTSLNGNTASIQTLQTVTDGLKAQYMVKTDVNGYVSGFGLYNTGASSEFIILADKFALVTPGQSPQVPFAVDVNGVYMNTAYIRNLIVDKIAGGNITAEWNINSANGRIVLDTGSHMKVIGVGFGANQDLVEWFGPKMAVHLCTKGNATTYTSMTGDAYWGGSLSAGTLKNATRTTSNLGDAEIINGPFATNGNPKSVVVSYNLNKIDVANSGTFLTPTGAVQATIGVYRTLGTGSETLVTTFTVNGTYERTNEAGGPSTLVNLINGSHSFTDNTPGTSNFTYRAKILARSFATANASSGTVSVNTQQSLGIISVEE
jgi:hypothetical protein